MKNIIRTCCALALIAPLCAGDHTPAPSTAPTTSSYDSTCWFLGGSADYMVDAEEVLWSGHIGYNLTEVSSLFIEAGWMGEDEDFTTFDGSDINVSIDVVPVTLNYQYEWALGDQLSWYLGVGAGAANIDVDVEDFGSEDEWSFMAQAFTGLVYEFTPAFEAYLGVRYMWIDEPDFGGSGDLEDFDDFGVGLGLRFNF